MKGRNSPTSFGCRILLVILTVVLTSVSNPVSCHALQTALLLQQSPAEGGTINLGEGVHHFEQYTEITLTAIPKSGWQFVCWLGEVGDTTAPNTTAFINTPKIIIAVFERVAYEFLIGDIRATSAPGQNLIPKPADYARGGGGGEVKYTPPTPPPPPPRPPTPPPPPPPSDFPVPLPEPDFPVPLPEPATALLLGLGSLFFVRRRTKK